jgi:hypothetical protein
MRHLRFMTWSKVVAAFLIAAKQFNRQSVLQSKAKVLRMGRGVDNLHPRF